MSKRPTPKRPKPAGGYIGQAMRLAGKPKPNPFTPDQVRAVYEIVRAEINAPENNRTGTGPSEKEIEEAARIYRDTPGTTTNGIRAALCWYAGRSKP